MRSDTEPIAVKDALKLVEMAIEDCDKATEGPWAWYQFAEKANSFALGIGCDIHGNRLAGHVDAEDITDTIMEGHGEIGAMEASVLNYGDPVFMVLSRAVMRPMLEFFKYKIETGFSEGIKFTPTGGMYGEINALYPPLAALRDHYDRTRPEWRMSK